MMFAKQKETEIQIEKLEEVMYYILRVQLKLLKLLHKHTHINSNTQTGLNLKHIQNKHNYCLFSNKHKICPFVSKRNKYAEREEDWQRENNTNLKIILIFYVKHYKILFPFVDFLSELLNLSEKVKEKSVSQSTSQPTSQSNRQFIERYKLLE